MGMVEAELQDGDEEEGWRSREEEGESLEQSKGEKQYFISNKIPH